MQKKIILSENREIEVFCLQLPNAKLIFALAPRGYVMCGYLNLDTAEKLQDAACVVSGIKSIEELLEKPVVKLTAKARELGINCAMSGREALEHMF